MAPVAGMPPKKRARDVGHALRDEFLVGIVVVVDHAVGHNGGKERLDGGEQGDGRRWPDQVAEVVPN